MFSRTVLSALVLSLSSACVVMTDPGDMVSESRRISEFDSLQVEEGIEVRVHIGEHGPAELVGHEKALDALELSVRQGTLHIGYRPFTKLYAPQVFVDVYTPAIEDIEASGGSRVEVVGTLEQEVFFVNTSGGSEVRILSMNVKNLYVHASGGSDIRLVGKGGKAEVEASGGSDVDLGSVENESVRLELSGGSHLIVRTSQSVKGEASGGSQIDVHGFPREVDVSLSGDSRISYK